jgi:hypothetical protein
MKKSTKEFLEKKLFFSFAFFKTSVILPNIRGISHNDSYFDSAAPGISISEKTAISEDNTLKKLHCNQLQI